MSIEYTLDIQLTELGFPDVQRAVEGTSDEQSNDSAASLSAVHKEKASGTRKSTLSTHPTQKSPRKQLNRTQSQPDSVENNGKVSDPKKKEPSSETQLLPTKQKAGGEHVQEKSTQRQQDVGEESDDSEVSEMYEEEEMDEEDDEIDDEELSDELNNSVVHRCSVCDLGLLSKFKLQDHMNLHTGARPYCCVECGKRFCQINNYRIHLRKHAKAKVDCYLCRICLTSFTSQHGLSLHLSKTHFEEQFYECDLCKRVFTSLKDCEAHVQLHKSMVNITCEVCGRNFPSEKSLARHRKKKCRCNFKCTDCTKTFTSKNSLLKHSFSHLGLLPYTCIRCHSHFRLAKFYRQHKCEPQRIHCVACLREFFSEEDFQQHKKDTGCWGIQDQDQKTDEIRCLECGQRFQTTDELKKHAGAHQRVLKCAECGKGFRSALLLMSHMGGHAGQSPCLCQTCGLGFPHQQNYDGHLKTCGQMAPSTSASKKRPSLKRPQPENSSKKANAAQLPNTASGPEVSPNNPAEPAEESGDSKIGAAVSNPPSGLWSLTLDKEPPPGVKLVLLLPVCQQGGVSIPPAISQTLHVAAVQAQTSGSEEGRNQLEVNSALGMPLNPPMQLLTEIKRETMSPLDLSNKSNSDKSAVSNAPPVSIKSEPEEYNVSSAENGSEKNDQKETWAMGMCNEVKRFKTDATASSPLAATTASQRLIVDIKKEPQSPDFPDFQISECRSDFFFKKEVDILGSACAVVDK